MARPNVHGSRFVLGSTDGVPSANFADYVDASPPVGRLPPGPIRVATACKPARLAKQTVLSPNATTGPFFVRRSALAPVFADVDPAEARLVPCILQDRDGNPLEDDWAWLEVVAQLPLDRDAAECAWDGENAHGAWLDKLIALKWGAEREPAERIVAVGESPNFVSVEPVLAKAIEKATRKRLFGIWFPVEHITPRSAITHGRTFFSGATVGDARAAETFWALRRGEAMDLAPVLTNAHYAYWHARRAGGSDALRAAACKVSQYAALYARFIDGGPRDDTRAAAVGGASWYYALYVDHGAHPSVRANWAAADTGDDYEAYAVGLLEQALGKLQVPVRSFS